MTERISVRIESIYRHRIYEACMEQIQVCEQEREYCKHDMIHFLDVARIACIMNLEESYQIAYDIIYASALLHDIGRHLQYLEGALHQIASAEIAERILTECGFVTEEINEILTAIRSHRNAKVKDKRNLEGLLYRADKASRPCFSCQKGDCNWKEKRNQKLSY